MNNPYQTPESEPEEKCHCVFRVGIPAWLEWVFLVMILLMSVFAVIGLDTVLTGFRLKFWE
jgi:hypothetical protein